MIHFAEFQLSRSMNILAIKRDPRSPQMFGFYGNYPRRFREDIPHKDTNIWVNETIFYSHISMDVRSVDTFDPVDGCSILTQMLGGRPNG